MKTEQGIYCSGTTCWRDYKSKKHLVPCPTYPSGPSDPGREVLRRRSEASLYPQLDKDSSCMQLASCFFVRLLNLQQEPA